MLDSNKPITITAALKWGQSLLTSHSDSPRLDAELILAFVLDKPRSYLYTWDNSNLSTDDLAVYQQLIEERSTGMPVAYLIGEQGFWNLNLRVSANTLIPRPDTETLIEIVLDHWGHKKELNVLDLGTGTGAIGLALASENPSWKVIGVDKIEEAVTLATLNSNLLNIQNFTAIQSDWFEAISDQRFDIIVSNPPYIEENDPHLSQGDVRFEPQTALTSGKDGLDDIRKICQSSSDFLKQLGGLYIEHGYNQGVQVRTIFSEEGFYDIKTVQDLGGQDRITFGSRTID